VRAAFEIYAKGAERIVTVTDDQVADAMRLYYRATHNVAEGAGAAALAALMAERQSIQGKEVAVILCGGNVDADVFKTVLEGRTPRVSTV
jgi:threonine dehydratase